MIAGSAILIWPLSAVTINVAIDATDKDHQRFRRGKEAMAQFKVPCSRF
jgi:hypothetical protein